MKPHHVFLARAPLARVLSLALGPAVVMAADDRSLPLWELGVGAAAYHQPNYPGSDVSSTSVLPFPYVIYRGDWLRINSSNLQGVIYETQRVKVDLSAGATSAVDSDESDARDGMPDLDSTVEIGPSVSALLSDPARSDNLWGQAAIRSAYSIDTDDWKLDHRGWIFDTKLSYQRPLIGESLQFDAEAGVAFADRDYFGYFYDVSPLYATPQRPEYRSDSGYAGTRLGLGLSGVHGRWRWSVSGGYHNLVGAAFSDSPLVDSKHDFSVGATVAWMFWQSESRVAPKKTGPGNSELNKPLLLKNF